MQSCKRLFSGVFAGCHNKPIQSCQYLMMAAHLRKRIHRLTVYQAQGTPPQVLPHLLANYPHLEDACQLGTEALIFVPSTTAQPLASWRGFAAGLYFYSEPGWWAGWLRVLREQRSRSKDWSTQAACKVDGYSQNLLWAFSPHHPQMTFCHANPEQLGRPRIWIFTHAATWQLWCKSSEQDTFLHSETQGSFHKCPHYFTLNEATKAGLEKQPTQGYSVAAFPFC